MYNVYASTTKRCIDLIFNPSDRAVSLISWLVYINFTCDFFYPQGINRKSIYNNIIFYMNVLPIFTGDSAKIFYVENFSFVYMDCGQWKLEICEAD